MPPLPGPWNAWRHFPVSLYTPLQAKRFFCGLPLLLTLFPSLLMGAGELAGYEWTVPKSGKRVTWVPVELRAVDSEGKTVTNVPAPVRLSSLPGAPTNRVVWQSTVILGEVRRGARDAVELINVGSTNADLSG